FVCPENRGLSFKTEDAAVNIRFMQKDAGIVDQITGWEIVGAINDDVIVFEDLHDIFGRKLGAISGDLDVGIDRSDAVFGGLYFGTADILGAKSHLALKIGEICQVEINQA